MVERFKRFKRWAHNHLCHFFLWLYGSHEEEVRRVVDEQDERIKMRKQKRIEARVNAAFKVGKRPSADDFAALMDPDKWRRSRGGK